MSILKQKSVKLPVCVEVNPPKGVDLDTVFGKLDDNLEGISFLNVTDSALARLKANALMFASILKNRYKIEPLVNLSCRDRNTIALQADILGAEMLGIKSIVALTGDSVSSGDHQSSKPVFEVNSVRLLEIISKLNRGVDLNDNPLSKASSITPGAVCNPNCKNLEAEIRKLQKKKDAGASYVLTQPVFDIEASKAFFSKAKEIGIELFIGLLPFKSFESLKAILSVPGISASENLLTKVQEMDESKIKDFSFELCKDILLENLEFVSGVHVVSAKTPKLALTLASELVKLYN